MQSEKGKELSTKGIQTKYGEEYTNSFQVPEIKEKIERTNLTKYGCINVSQNKDIQNKVKTTKENWTDEQKQIISNKISNNC